MTNATVDPAPAAPGERTSLWEDFIDVLFSPASVFRRRQQGSWVKPLLIVSIAISVVVFASMGVLQPIYDAELDKAVEKMRENPQFTEQMIEQARSVSRVFTYVFIVISMPLAIIIVGFVSWLVGKLLDSKQELHAAFVVSAYAMVPRVLQAILNAVQGLLLKPEQLSDLTKLSFSPARFMDAATTSPVVMQILNRFDLFTIWVTVLIGIGLYVTGRMSKAGATTAAIIIWVLGSIPAILGGLQRSR